MSENGAAGSEARSGGSRPWVRIALFLSLALNLLIIGMVAGAILRGGPGDRRAESGRADDLPYVRALTHRQRQEVGARLRQALAGDPETRRAVVQELRRGVGLLAREPFDPAAFEAHLDRLVRLGAKRRSAGMKVLSQYLADMSPEERAQYLERLQQVLRDTGRRDRRGGG